MLQWWTHQPTTGETATKQDLSTARPRTIPARCPLQDIRSGLWDPARPRTNCPLEFQCSLLETESGCYQQHNLTTHRILTMRVFKNKELRIEPLQELPFALGSKINKEEFLIDEQGGHF